MKPLLAALVLAWCVTVSAQSVYTNYLFCNDGTNVQSLTFAVPISTTAHILYVSSGVGGAGAYQYYFASYPGNTNEFEGEFPKNLYSGSTPPALPVVLGPASIRVPIYQSIDGQNCVNLLVRFDAVNGTPGNFGAVQLPQTSKAVELQASTNLTEWQAVAVVTNTTDASYKFYRVQIR